MAISMVCPQCKARFNFNDAAAGKKARCQKCQAVFVVEAPPPADDIADINLEVIEDEPKSAAKPKAPPPKDPTKPAARPPAKPSRKETSADDFDAEAFGGFSAGGDEDERPARKRSRRDDDVDVEEVEERPARKRSRRDEDDDEDGSSAARSRRDSGDPDKASRGTGFGIKGGKYPLWLKFVVFAVVMAVTAGQVQFWLKDKNEEEGTFGRMKKKLIRYAILGIVLVFLVCGGVSALIFGLFASKAVRPHSFSDPSPVPPGPGQQGIQRTWRDVVADGATDWNTWTAPADLALEVPTGGRAWTSDTPSRFVAIGRFPNPFEVTVWNVETKQPVGPPIKENGFANRGGILSRDGDHFAVWSNQEIMVYSARTGQKLPALRGDPGDSVLWAGFTTPGRLVGLLRRPSQQVHVATWDVTNGARTPSTATLDARPAGNNPVAAVSPGGRYLAFVSNLALEVVDLERNWVNRMPVRPNPNATVNEVQGLAFSHNGGILVALVESNDGPFLVNYNFVSGAVNREYRLDGLTRDAYLGRRVEWLPRGSGWLINGRQILDSSTGILRPAPPFRPGEVAVGLRRVINETQMLTGAQRSQGGRRETQVVVVAPPN